MKRELKWAMGASASEDWTTSLLNTRAERERLKPNFDIIRL
jgi:hypothetical protein